jgi:phosphonate transport system ATP-binding protein
VDPVTTERVMEALLELNGEGATLLVNLHDVKLARRFPRVVALREGRVVFDSSPAQLTDEILSQIYAGDPYGSAASPADPQNNSHPRGEDPVRLMEGRDGVSAH